MNKKGLWIYVVGVAVTLAIANWVAYSVGGNEKLASMEIFSAGLIIGMTAMYLAVNFYRRK
jgi:putative effector of murein hydrolase